MSPKLPDSALGSTENYPYFLRDVVPTFDTWIGHGELQGGWWQIGGSLHFSIKNRPSRWSRFWHRALLGWIWVPVNEHNR